MSDEELERTRLEGEKRAFQIVIRHLKERKAYYKAIGHVAKYTAMDSTLQTVQTLVREHYVSQQQES